MEERDASVTCAELVGEQRGGKEVELWMRNSLSKSVPVMNIHTHTGVHTGTCMHIHVYIQALTHIDVHAHTHVCIHIYPHMNKQAQAMHIP